VRPAPQAGCFVSRLDVSCESQIALRYWAFGTVAVAPSSTVPRDVQQSWLGTLLGNMEAQLRERSAEHQVEAYQHAPDLDTGAVVAAEVHAASEGDTTTITRTLDAAQPDERWRAALFGRSRRVPGQLPRGLEGTGWWSLEDPDY
jgi:hypothetical protein